MRKESRRSLRGGFGSGRRVKTRASAILSRAQGCALEVFVDKTQLYMGVVAISPGFRHIPGQTEKSSKVG